MAKHHFAYYVSGHGFGHATRVVAITHALLDKGHSVSIVTDAREFIFHSVIARGASYRKAPIDAGIAQPLAYSVDRQKTLVGLQQFLNKRDELIDIEVDWLIQQSVDAVISDAPFLPCAAAKKAGIPSSILSNFTFDSCYSYLSTPADPDDPDDAPLEASVLEPLVQQTVDDYANASLLLRLPGAIPIPAFDTDVPMPASVWVDLQAHSFTKEIEAVLDRPTHTIPSTTTHSQRVVDTPLVTRRPSKHASDPERRKRFLTSFGVPDHLHTCPILLVSFGGQNIPRPGSRAPSPSASPILGPPRLPPVRTKSIDLLSPTSLQNPRPISRVATSEHLYVPGAPPALTHITSPPLAQASFNPVPSIEADSYKIPRDGLLPEGWIALVCGLGGADRRDDLPDRFFACPTDVYIPDVCAISSVLLGKLGYGTCSETIAAGLPFVFVSRPLFVEEYGLKRLTQARNTLIEMDRESFEQGQWEAFVLKAYEQHRSHPPSVFDEEDAGDFIVRHLESWMAS